MTRGALLASSVLLCTLATACGGTNHAPFLAPIPDVEVQAGETVSFQVAAEDPDGDGVALSLDGLPGGATFAEGAFSWTTTAADAGAHYLVVTATDDGAPPLKSAVLVRVLVHDPLHDNHAPVWYGVPADGTASVGVVFSASFEAADPDGDALTYVARPLPAGATLEQSPTIGTLHWTPQAADVGEHDFIVFAIDHGEPSMSIGMLYRITVAP